MDRIFALVDCNNFYASCERVFQPGLKKRPVAVLSNNDGCVVARSNEVKALGIPMGAPFHKHREVFERHDVAVFSSNYQLYGDMSERVITSLGMLAPDIEVYSIDEAFLRLDGFGNHNLTEMALDIRAKVLQWTGIPTSLGIAPTKTLAKIANHVAKKRTESGVFDLRDQELQTKILKDLPTTEIWGIAGRRDAKLGELGIHTALQLRDADPKRIRQAFGVVVERIVLELGGVACLDLEDIAPKQQILRSRSFGKMQSAFEPVAEALATHAARACEKLRHQKSKAQGVHVFLSTNRHRKSDPQYSNGGAAALALPSSDTAYVIRIATELLRSLYRTGYNYKKCGIMLLDLVPEGQWQGHLFAHKDDTRTDHLMEVVDGINRSMGPGAVFHGAQGIGQEWRMRAERRSPRYTTKWDELARAR